MPARHFATSRASSDTRIAGPTCVPVSRSARSNHEIRLCVCVALSVVVEPHREFSLQPFVFSRECWICPKSVTERELRPQLLAVSRRDIQVMAAPPHRDLLLGGLRVPPRDPPT